MYYNYVLLDKNTGKCYIGFCVDINKRLAEHKSKQVFFTKQYSTLELVYTEGCISKKDALVREKQLKTGFGRGYIKNE
jgi:putative endonuclease